jgi:hypothetical protein
MRYGPRNFLASLGLIAAGALASQALTPGGAPFIAAQSRSGQGGSMQVINNKVSETMVVVYDEESKRLLLYTATTDNGIKLAGVRNTTYDAKVNEYPKHPDDKLSYKEVRKAVEEEEKQKAEEDAKRAKETKKKDDKTPAPPAPPAPPPPGNG